MADCVGPGPADPAAPAGPAALLRAGGPRVVPERPERARPRGRDGARPALSADVDPVPVGGAAARPERPRKRRATSRPGTHLQRRVVAVRGGERCVGAGPWWQPAGGPAASALLAVRDPRLGPRHGAAA